MWRFIKLSTDVFPNRRGVKLTQRRRSQTLSPPRTGVIAKLEQQNAVRDSPNLLNPNMEGFEEGLNKDGREREKERNNERERERDTNVFLHSYPKGDLTHLLHPLCADASLCSEHMSLVVGLHTKGGHIVFGTGFSEGREDRDTI